VRSPKWQWPLQALMVRHMGLPVSALKGDLDRLYLEKLLEYVRTSSLDAVVILAHEQVYDEGGRLLKHLGTCHVPNDYVLRLAHEHREFLPAVSIHPARQDALEELDRCIAEGAVMMKCLPNCQMIDCRDPRYTRFWERMAEAGLPLLAHTGGEHTLQVLRPDLQDPRILQRPLECGVTVIAAHTAGKSGFGDPEYFHYFAEMALKYENFYGDNSAFNIPIRSRLVPKCRSGALAEKILHGSDFPVPVLGIWSRLRGHLPSEAYRKWQKQPNVIERDYQFKRAMGFPEETFTRLASLLPKMAMARSG
jgi:hypothetical protein